MNPLVRLMIMPGAFVLWMLPFLLNRARGQGTATRTNPKARVGIVVVSFGYFMAYMHSPKVWNSPLEVWRAVLGVAFALAAIALAWFSVGNLGKQWRVDAALNEDHELVQTGAYRLVRHPIYLSMFFMLSMGLAVVGTLPGWPVAIVLFVIGTEIRIRVEDNLLKERFGEKFVEWQRRVPAYLPFVR